MQPPIAGGIAATVTVDVGDEQLRPSDAEVVPLGLPQPAEQPERRALLLPLLMTIESCKRRCCPDARGSLLSPMRSVSYLRTYSQCGEIVLRRQQAFNEASQHLGMIAA